LLCITKASVEGWQPLKSAPPGPRARLSQLLWGEIAVLGSNHAAQGMRERQRDRETERERKTERDRETERQRDREIERDRER
jgi:hypothetical protein